MPVADPRTETRREHFRALCRRKGWFDEARQKWAVTEIAHATLKPTNKVSDLLNGKGSFGAKIARELESALGLPEFALEQADAPDQPGEQPPHAVQMDFEPIRPPTLQEAVAVLGEALNGLDALGRQLAGPVLAALLENPGSAAEMGEELAAIVARRSPPPTTPTDKKRRVTAPEKRATGMHRMTVTEGGGKPKPQLGLRLPLRTVANPFDVQQAPKKEADWYQQLKAKPKAREE